MSLWHGGTRDDSDLFISRKWNKGTHPVAQKLIEQHMFLEFGEPCRFKPIKLDKKDAGYCQLDLSVKFESKYKNFIHKNAFKNAVWGGGGGEVTINHWL